MFIGLGLGLGMQRRAAAGGGGIVIPPLATAVIRPVANRTKQTFIDTHSSDGVNLYGVYRSRHKVFPGWAVSGGLRIWYANRCSEANGFNSITVSAAIEYPAGSGNWTDLTFEGGASSVTMVASAVDRGTDPIDLDMTAGSYFRVRTRVSVASAGQKWPVLDRISLAAANGEGYALSDSAPPADPADSDCDEYYGPVAITGYSKAPYAIGVFGDSISNGSFDDGTLDKMGFFQKPILDYLPIINLSTGGDRPSQFNTAAGHLYRMALADSLGLTHALVAYGTNDISAGASTIEGYLETTFSLLARRNWHLSASAILSHTNSTDDWATAANQTPASGYTVGGTADQVSDWLETQVGTLIDRYIDTRPAWQDENNKIFADGTPFWMTDDGLHPNANGYAAIAGTLDIQSMIPFSSKSYAYEGWDDLVGHFDAADGRFFPGIAGVMSEWRNKVAGAGDLAPGAGTSGTISRATAAQYDRCGVTFTRTGSPSSTSIIVAETTDPVSQALAGTNKDFTMICVFKPTASGAMLVGGWSEGVSGSIVRQCTIVWRPSSNSSFRYGATGDANLDVNIGSLAISTVHIVAIKHSAGTTSAWVNGLTKVLDAAAQAPAAAFTTPLFTIGSTLNVTGTSPPWNGNGLGGSMLEFVASSSAHSDADIQQAITDLAAKWGKTLS